MKREYEYDAAGNRTARRVLILQKTSSTLGHKSANNDSEGNEPILIDEIEDIRLKVYPNPTTSIVHINIEQVDLLQNGSIHIYNTIGTHIKSQSINSLNTSIDLSSYPSGIYLITIMINGKETKWKIIKE
jgi:hypothetical protein